MVIVDTELTVYQTSTLKNENSRRHQVASLSTLFMDRIYVPGIMYDGQKFVIAALVLGQTHGRRSAHL